MTLIVKVKRTTGQTNESGIRMSGAPVDWMPPIYGSAGAGMFDIRAVDSVTIHGNHEAYVNTGLIFEVPEGHVMLMMSRSSLAKNGVTLSNDVGVIDSDYRGEVRVPLMNRFAKAFHVNAGDRIAQAMIIPVPKVMFTFAETLSDTKRGTGGFGSTGRG